MGTIHQSLPKARRSKLITAELEGELLVYDQSSNKAHCLNESAAFVWARCDGQTSVASIAGLLQRERKTPVSDEVVWFALDQLEKSHLLQESLARPAELNHLSRRALVKRLGIAAALTLPLVTSLIAPTAAEAATCGAVGAACTTNADCCSDSCVDNGRGGLECT
jgi:Coenzyme PQQ synthesis protein D (PqqD)